MTIEHGFHAAIPAQKGKGEELVALLMQAPALTNEDCLVFLVGRSAGDADLVFVTEGWRSAEAHGRFFNSEAAKDYTARVGALVNGDSLYADEIPVGGKAIFD